MNWVSQIFFVVVVTALIGDVVFAMWWLFQLAFMRWSPSLVYNTLRWIVVLFLLPVGYLAIKISHHSDYSYSPDALWQSAFLINETMMPVVGGFTIIWLIGVVITARIVIKKKRSCDEDKELNVVETDHFVLSEQKRIQEFLGVKQRIAIIRNPEIDVPHVKGNLKKQIMIPCNKYTHDEITITLYHELTHVKKHDLFFKLLGWVVVSIQWFNPMVYLIPKALNRWSENDCDAKALKLMEKEFDAVSYYRMLYGMASDEQHRRHLLNFSMLVEDKRSIERRIEYMGKLQNAAKLPKIVTVMLAAAFTLLSTTTAYAAGIAMADANDKVCKATEKVTIVGATGAGVNVADESEQFIVTAEESKDVPTVYMESDVMPLSVGSFAWTISAGTRYVSGQIYLSKGDVVTITCSVKPTSSTYWYGLVLPNGNSKVAQGSGACSSDFEATSSGYYRIMVQNLSSVEIEAGGSYIY